MSSQARSVMAEMEIGYIKPFLVRDVARRWHSFQTEPGGDVLLALKSYLTKVIEEAVQRVDPDAVLPPISEAVDSIWNQPSIQVRDIVFKANQAFDMLPINIQQIREVMTEAHSRMDEAHRTSRSVSKALVLVRRAETWLESVSKGITTFIMDRETAPAAFGKTARERERFAEAVLSDVTSYLAAFERCRQELTQIDVRAVRDSSACDRALASVRQFTDAVERDRRGSDRAGHLNPVAQDVLAGNRPGAQVATFGGGNTRTRFAP